MRRRHHWCGVFWIHDGLVCGEKLLKGTRTYDSNRYLKAASGEERQYPGAHIDALCNAVACNMPDHVTFETYWYSMNMIIHESDHLLLPRVPNPEFPISRYIRCAYVRDIGPCGHSYAPTTDNKVQHQTLFPRLIVF
jgi:hypothetical protein